MAEVLSQSEIDALLSAVSTGEVDTKPDSAPVASTDWIAYDLTSQEKIIRSRFAGLEGIHDRFAAQFRVTLSNMLHRTVSVNTVNTDFVRFGDYLTNVLLPTSLNVSLMPALKGHAILVVGSKLTYALVDAYYGGTERPYSKIGGREEFTGIETQLVGKMVRAALADMKSAWALNHPVDFRYLRSESNPQFVGAIHPTELVAVVSFEVEFENLSGPFTVVLQMSALESIQGQLAVNILSDVSQETEKWKRHWTRELLQIPLDLKVELGALNASLRQVKKWEAGQELVLSQDAAIPLQVYLQGLEKLKGTMGTCRGSRAVRLTDLPARKEG